MSDQVTMQQGNWRQFFTVKGAVKWMLAYRSRQTSLSQDLARGGSSRNMEALARAQATYARVLACLQPTMPEVDGENLTGRIDELVSWLCGDRSQDFLADEAGLTVHLLSKRVGKTERFVRVRMEEKDLLKERDW